MTRVLLLMGPTASGKSALALALAEELGGEIVNADSMQVYGDLRVLTARPTTEDEARAPHHLYGRVDAAERYSVGRWLEDALAAIGAIRARGATPIVVGGTGLYFSALTRGLADIPAAEPELRADLQRRLEAEGAAALHARLAVVDSETAARLQPNDAPRILRALEVWETTGRSIGAHHQKTTPPLARDEWTGLLLSPPRASLYAAINSRFDAMLRAGALEEVRALAARRLDSQLPAMKAHGAPALMAHLRDELGLPDAAEIARRDTRRYAKRQFTWMAGQMADWPHIPSVAPEERMKLAKNLLSEQKITD
ncbi:tRNA dimethylallyltransferase [alpha proteobacterium U9-1i]|nr:tRNA dimethylallyltransferase [alpha proteobacterium U9-1i]